MNRVVVVTGSRSWVNYRLLSDALSLELSEALRTGSGLTVRHGAARSGGDQLAASWVRLSRLQEHLTEDPVPADWEKYTRYRAGRIRNEKMLTKMGHVDKVLGFLMRCRKAECATKPIHGTHGTTHCLETAAAWGIAADIYREPALPQILPARKEDQ